MLFTLQAMSFNLETFKLALSITNYVLGNESTKKDLALTKGKIKIKNNVLEKVTEKQARNTRTCKLLVSNWFLTLWSVSIFSGPLDVVWSDSSCNKTRTISEPLQWQRKVAFIYCATIKSLILIGSQ